MSKRILEIAAPAKTNLWLRILGRREDGYHEIRTRMVSLSLEDRITLELAPGTQKVSLTCSDASLSTGEDNLVMRAVRILEEHCDREFELRLHLDKQIPIAAGLGGGSSDAAAVLKGVDSLLGLKLVHDELTTLASRLGSDVPFFVYDSPCDCTGRGEIVTPADFQYELPILLIKPPFGISAARAYRNWEGSKEIPGVSYAPQMCPWGGMANDLERPAFEEFPVLARLKTWLLDQSETRAALLSGSGSCILAVLVDSGTGRSLAARLQKRFDESMWTFVGHTCAASS